MAKPSGEERFEFKGVGDVPIACRAWLPGGPARAALVLVHGLGEHCGRYGFLVERMAREGFATYGLDHRGHGTSGGRRGVVGRFDEFSDDLGSFLGLVGPRVDGPLVAYGHSMGAAVLLRRLQRHDDGLAAAVLSAPPFRIPIAVPWVKRSMAPVLSSLAPWLTLDNEIDNRWVSRDPEVLRAMDADPLMHHRISPRLYTEILAAVAALEARPGPFPCPLLFIHGTDDPIADAAGTRAFHAAARCPPGSELRIFEGYLHELHNELQREMPLEAVATWLAARVTAVATT